VFKTLLEIQDKLPRVATGAGKAGAQPSYDHPAGMALLGLKDGRLDTVVDLAMSGGCWDAPNINHKDFDKGFRKMIESDRIVSGMALIRHPRWSINNSDDNSDHKYDAKIPSHLKSQIHGLRTAFADITTTVWIVLHNSYFRLYRPCRDAEGRVSIREITGQKLFEDTDKESKLIKKKFASDAKAKVAKAKAKEEQKKFREEQKKFREEQEKRWKLEEERELKREEARKKKEQDRAVQVGLDLKEGKKSIINAGNGLSYVKGKDGKYILWQTGR
jgi:hypothetical protein